MNNSRKFKEIWSTSFFVSYLLKGNTFRFGSAIQGLPSNIVEYFSSYFIIVLVVVLIFIFILSLKNVFLSILNSFVRNKVYLLCLLTYLLIKVSYLKSDRIWHYFSRPREDFSKYNYDFCWWNYYYPVMQYDK